MTAPDPRSLRLGFVGLGQIGAPMAARWIGWPGGLTVFDVAEAAVAPLEARGATVAPEVGALAAVCDVVSVMVRDDGQVREVVGAVAGAAAPGTAVVVHSTVDTHTPAELAERCAQRDIGYLDAPVSGGFMGASDGTLAVMVGGDADVLDRVRPALDEQAGLIAHLGPVGAGTRAKLARNLITFASYAAVGEACRLAEAAGVDLVRLGDVVRHSDRITGGPGAIMLRDSVTPLAEDDGLRPIFEHTRGLGEKDLQLAIELGRTVAVDTDIAEHALRWLAPALGVPHDDAADGEGRGTPPDA